MARITPEFVPQGLPSGVIPAKVPKGNTLGVRESMVKAYWISAFAEMTSSMAPIEPAPMVLPPRSG